jgi:Carboxypeptidase regulatory-like domain
MRRIAKALAVTGAVIGLGIPALPATASTSARVQKATRAALTPAQSQALRRLNSQSGKHGLITGFVLRGNGKPEANVCVRAIGAHTSKTAFSGLSGQFVIGGLPIGAYLIEYRGCSPIASVVGQWYGGLTRATATKVVVSGAVPAKLAPVRLDAVSPRFEPRVTHQSLALRLTTLLNHFKSVPAQVRTAGAKATISGKVTNKAGHPIPNECAEALPVRTHGVFYGPVAATSAAGTYSLRVGRPGRYWISFVQCGRRPQNYAPQFWNGAASVGAARVLQVKTGQHIGNIDAVLGVGARIAGKVKAASGATKPVGGLCVAATGTGGQRYFFGQTQTNADGSFQLSGLGTGKYSVSVFSGCGKASDYLPATAKKLISVTDGRTTSGLVITLQLGGVITGKVTDTANSPLAGICASAVQTIQLSNGIEEILYGSPTGKNGSYQIGGLPTGSYQMQFSTGCGNNGPYASVTLPANVKVTKGQTTAGVNAVMPTDGSIKGLVTSKGGKPLGGVCVVAQGSNFNFAFTKTAANGTYDAKKVAPDNYQVQFVPGGAFSNCGLKGNYVPALESTTVTSGTATTLNAVLPTGGVISGVVTNAHGKPEPGVCVESAGPVPNQTVSGANGSYRLSQLLTGPYEVGFFGGCGNAGSVAPQVYRSDPTFLGPKLINVTVGDLTTGIDARMLPGATISGHVTDQSGRSLSGICVSIVGATGAAGDADFGAEAISHHGVYSTSNLPPGQYSVIFSGLLKHHGCNISPYADQQFSGKPLGAALDTVYAAGGVTTAGVNATLVPAGKISGVVTNQKGRGVSAICVTATDAATHATEEAFTAGHGKYVITGLPAGRYKVDFTNCNAIFALFGISLNYANQWYNDSLTSSGATTVVVAADHTTPGIDASMKEGGSFTGQVLFKPNGRPVAFVCVVALTPNLSSFSEGITDRHGFYKVTGLSTDRYIVEFEPCSFESALAGQVKAGSLQIVAGKTVHRVDERVQVGGSIAGVAKYRSAGGAIKAAPGTCVEVLPTSLTGLGEITFSGPGGSYDATNLAPGTYQVLFGQPNCSSDAPQLTARFSAQVGVAATHTTTVNATLNLAGGISGVVRSAAGGRLSGICAKAELASGGTAAVVGITAGGAYQIGDLQPGRYKVEFTTGCGAAGYATRWFTKATSRRQATVIVVKAGQTSNGIDGTLPRG